MPNLVEQAELVKRLTNDQLAVAMQNPTGAIPPFIFAAEAARRQAIQEQFSGGPKESVVDTLTKQMAKVPQNIQSGQMTTPPVPPTPQMQGVMALQQQQAMQQAAQQAMPQQAMRAGGPVRRFQSAGFVGPVRPPPPVGGRIQEIADQFGFTVEEAAEALKNNPSLAGGATEAQMGRPFTVLDQPAPGSQPAKPLATGDTRLFGMTPYDYLKMGAGFFGPGSLFGLDPLTVYKHRQEDDKRAETEKRAETSMLQGDEAFQDYAAQARRLVRPAQVPPKEDTTVESTSYENQIANRKAEIKNRLEKLLGEEEVSDWEKAQKWFAASQQFLEPDQTLMQSLVGAAAAFSGGAAEERAAERAAARAKEKAMIEWDMAELESDQTSRQREIDRRTLDAKQMSDILLAKLRIAESDVAETLRKIDDARGDPSKEALIPGLEKALESQTQRREEARGDLAALGAQAYGPMNYEVFGYNDGFR
jgi:AraC-like DNA-binding protein